MNLSCSYPLDVHVFDLMLRRQLFYNITWYAVTSTILIFLACVINLPTYVVLNLLQSTLTSYLLPTELPGAATRLGEEQLATTTKWTTTGKCIGIDVVQHLHQRPARTCRHSQLHLRRRLMNRVVKKRFQQHRNVTHVCPEYYDHLLRLKPTACEPLKETGVCVFYLRNREAKREPTVLWNDTRLSNTTTPVYLGGHLDRTLCYKTHIEKTKMKVNARNNIICKLANSKWGCKASTPRPS